MRKAPLDAISYCTGDFNVLFYLCIFFINIYVILILAVIVRTNEKPPFIHSMSNSKSDKCGIPIVCMWLMSNPANEKQHFTMLMLALYRKFHMGGTSTQSI